MILIEKQRLNQYTFFCCPSEKHWG